MPYYKSPTGSLIVGTLETIQGSAQITEITEAGDPVYAGDTEVFWDSQETVERDGQTVFLDEDGEEWVFGDLTVADEDDDADSAAQ